MFPNYTIVKTQKQTFIKTVPKGNRCFDYCFARIAAWAADNLAIGTRNGEQET